MRLSTTIHRLRRHLWSPDIVVRTGKFLRLDANVCSALVHGRHHPARCLVPAGHNLITDTVRENIRFFRRDITDDQVERAA